MLHVRQSNIGVDLLIDKYQRSFYLWLAEYWQQSTEVWECYPRCDRYQDKGEYFPAFFREDTHKDYSYVSHQDNSNVTAFFGIGETTTYKQGSRSTPCHMVIVIDLSRIKFSVSHFPNNEAVESLLSFARRDRFGFRLQSYEQGLDACFREYSGYRKTSDAVRHDTYPMACFRFNYLINHK